MRKVHLIYSNTKTSCCKQFLSLTKYSRSKFCFGTNSQYMNLLYLFEQLLFRKCFADKFYLMIAMFSEQTYCRRVYAFEQQYFNSFSWVTCFCHYGLLKSILTTKIIFLPALPNNACIFLSIQFFALPGHWV
ncbi:MAG: hypothetical protein BWX95_02495 [Bacteroidetes bacterium ADurb.Bin141]|nr:MAG: hypothetical protein BWX95_02495 [Bacteroidetes bacterium ADurb.Bin141]